MESDWTDDIIRHKAKVILLTDDEGGPANWMAALACGAASWTRALLDHPNEPLTMRLNRTGNITRIAGEQELRARRDQLLTGRIVRNKKSRGDESRS